MLNAARKIQRFVLGLSQEQFVASELHQSAIINELRIIGEASRVVSDETKGTTPQIAWTKIAGLRNRLVHEYFRIDLDIIWNIVQEDIPTLIEQIAPLIPLDQDSEG
ncbi:MAG: DUF86 domain-containing protein [Anaerolineae bacterium]|nr:DUF86 domain-containing protein [Anaerolineae bacterium]